MYIILLGFHFSLCFVLLVFRINMGLFKSNPVVSVSVSVCQHRSFCFFIVEAGFVDFLWKLFRIHLIDCTQDRVVLRWHWHPFIYIFRYKLMCVSVHWTWWMVNVVPHYNGARCYSIESAPAAWDQSVGFLQTWKLLQISTPSDLLGDMSVISDCLKRHLTLTLTVEEQNRKDIFS